MSFREVIVFKEISKGANSSVKKRQCHGRVYQFNPPAPIWQIDGLTFWNNLPESIFGMKKDHRQNKVFWMWVVQKIMKFEKKNINLTAI